MEAVSYTHLDVYKRQSHNREFHNVNCRFCGAIHNVDRTLISALQTLRSTAESAALRDVYKRQFRLRMNLPVLSSGHGADNDPIDSGKVNCAGIVE